MHILLFLQLQDVDILAVIWIISFVVIKYKKIFRHAATEKNPTEKRASCTSRVMFCSLKVA